MISNSSSAPITSTAIDLLDPGSFAHGHPLEQYRWLRENDPVHRHAEPEGPGYWALTRYADVWAVGRDADTFSSEPTVLIQETDVSGDGVYKMMITADGEDHTRLRKMASRNFVPRAVRLLRPRIIELAREIIHRVEMRGECDLVADVAELMPSYLIAEMLDIPHEDGVTLCDLTAAIHTSPSDPYAIAQIFSYARDLWERKRGHPGDDLASRMVLAPAGDRPLNEVDFALHLILLMDAGRGTTRSVIAGGMQVLFEHQEELAALRADPDGLLPLGLEELLRWVSPVIYMRRRAIRDAVIGNREIAAGDKVVMYYGAANYDPEHFTVPDRLNLRRTPNDHLAFGGGPHFCLGAHVGRLEIDAMLRELLALPDLEPAGPVEWQQSSFISGPRRMPVRFTRC